MGFPTYPFVFFVDISLKQVYIFVRWLPSMKYRMSTYLLAVLRMKVLEHDKEEGMSWKTELEVRRAYESLKPAPSVIAPSAAAHLLTLPTQLHSQGTKYSDV